MNSGVLMMYFIDGFSSILWLSTEMTASCTSFMLTFFLPASSAFACALSYMPIVALTLGFLLVSLFSRRLCMNSIIDSRMLSGNVVIVFPFVFTISFSIAMVSG